MRNKNLKYLFLLLIIIFLSSSCQGSKPSKRKEIDLNKKPKIEEEPDFSESGLKSQESLIKGLDSNAVEEAHRYLIAYPNARIDTSKGSYSKSDFGDNFNLVYYTDDPVKKVEEFFLKNIANEYLTKTSPPESTDWIIYEYEVPTVRHSGTLSIRKAEDGTTEIIYMITRKAE